MFLGDAEIRTKVKDKMGSLPSLDVSLEIDALGPTSVPPPVAADTVKVYLVNGIKSVKANTSNSVVFVIRVPSESRVS